MAKKNVLEKIENIRKALLYIERSFRSSENIVMPVAISINEMRERISKFLEKDSLRKISAEINISCATLSAFVYGKSIPSPRTQAKIKKYLLNRSK